MFEDDQIAGVPFYSLFFDLIETRGGQNFFGNKIVNQHLKNIFDDYNIMLCSNVSTKYLNEDDPNGWFCKRAQSYVNY